MHSDVIVVRFLARYERPLSVRTSFRFANGFAGLGCGTFRLLFLNLEDKLQLASVHSDLPYNRIRIENVCNLP